MKIEDILKAKGLTDADIANMSTLLDNPQYRDVLEGSYRELAMERDNYMKRDQEWQQLKETSYEPALRAAEEDARKARLEAAQYRESIKIAKEYGYLDDAADARAAEAAEVAKRNQSAPGTFDPKAHKLVTYDDVAEFALREGDAIATAQDLSEEYRSLTGKSLLDYQGADGKRGMRALLAEARNARLPIDQYVSTKFDFAGKRQAAEQQRQREWEDRIRKEEREKFVMEHAQTANPFTTPRTQSRNPFVPPAPKEGGMPWEKTAQERRSMRVLKATQNELKTTVN